MRPKIDLDKLQDETTKELVLAANGMIDSVLVANNALILAVNVARQAWPEPIANTLADILNAWSAGQNSAFDEYDKYLMRACGLAPETPDTKQ